MNKNTGIDVLSLFNGMGCIWLALEEAGINVNRRYSSEIEKYPNQANDLLYPDTVQLGDVRKVNAKDLGFLDMLAGGSPCQSFSFAGKRKGMSTKCEIEILTLNSYLELKNQEFEFEGQSYLFWEFIRILEEIRLTNPNVKFLLENVIMGKKWQKIITQAIGINPIRINSGRVSAQNRDRLYWTNIDTETFGLFDDHRCSIKQPKDEGILLKDILETAAEFESQAAFDKYINKYYLSKKAIDGFVNHSKRMEERGNGFKFEPSEGNGKSRSVTTAAGSRTTDNFIAEQSTIIAVRGRGESGNLTQQIEVNKTGKSNALTTVEKDNLVLSGTLRTHNDGKGFREVKSGKGATVPARAREDGSGQNIVKLNNKIRRLTPRECGRLQTVPEDKLTLLLNSGISDTQLYKMFGNGWTIKVIAYIAKHYKK